MCALPSPTQARRWRRPDRVHRTGSTRPMGGTNQREDKAPPCPLPAPMPTPNSGRTPIRAPAVGSAAPGERVDGVLHAREEVVRRDPPEQPTVLQVVMHQVRRAGDGGGDAPRLEVERQLARRRGPPCSRCRRCRSASSTKVFTGVGEWSTSSPHLLRHVVGVAVPERCVDAGTRAPPGPVRWAARCRVGSSGRCRARGPGPRRGAGRCGASGRTATAASPPRPRPRCRTGPPRSRVTTASPNSRRSKWRIARSSPTRNSRVATYTRMAPSVAWQDVVEQPGGVEHDRERGGGGREPGQLGAAPGARHHLGPGWAGVDGERPDEARGQAAGAECDEVAVEVIRGGRALARGADRCGGLDDAEERDGERRADEAAHVAPRRRGHADRGQPAVDGAQHRDAVVLQPQRGRHRRRDHQADERAGDAAGRCARTPRSPRTRRRRWPRPSRSPDPARGGCGRGGRWSTSPRPGRPGRPGAGRRRSPPRCRRAPR